MKFGYFDDSNKEYVITSPKTPLPWINYLGCESFFSLISNTIYSDVYTSVPLTGISFHMIICVKSSISTLSITVSLAPDINVLIL